MKKFISLRTLFTLKFVGIFVLFLFYMNSHASSDKRIKGIIEVTSVEGITEYRLKNGLQVLLYPDQTQDVITVNVTYHVGSKHENYGETGMAHLLEHLLFKGTPKHPNIPDELSTRGAKPNGTTSQDRTNYFETFAATEDNLAWALGLEADRMVNSFVRKEDLDSEMTVVRNELERGENNPFRVTLQKMRAASYMWHNYGKSTIGAVADLENVSIDRLQKFYRTYYQPDNATLVVAGKFDKHTALKFIGKTFGKIKKPKRVLPPIYTEEAPSDGERSVTVRRVGDIQLLMASYHTPASAHIDNAALAVLSQIMGDTPSGRLHKNLVEKKLATQIFSWLDEQADSSVFMAGAIVDKNVDLKPTQEALLKQIEKLLDQPIDKKEFERAQRVLLNGFEKSASKTESLAIELSDWVTAGDWRLRYLRRDQIRDVTLEQVSAVVDKYLKISNRTLGIFIPTERSERVSIEKKPDLDALLAGYTGSESIALGEEFDPSFDNIAKRMQTETLAQTIALSLIEKKTRGEKVALAMQLNFGDATSLENTQQFIEYVGAMLTKGTASKSRADISDALDAINTQLSISTSKSAARIQIETKKEHVATAIALLADILKNPSFPAKELSLLKAEVKTSLEYSMQDPNTIAQTAADKRSITVSESHPLYIASTQERLSYLNGFDRSTLDDFHKKFLSADNMLVSAVGDFDKDNLKAILVEHFGSWKKGVTHKKLTLPYKKIDSTPLVFDTPDKENGIFLAVDVFNINKNHPDYPALVLGNTVFGGGFINSRLATRLRQKEGWSYGAGSSLQGAEISERTRFYSYAIGAPQNLEKIQAAYLEELNKMLEAGFSKEEIVNARNGMTQRARLARAKDASLANMLLNDLYFEKPFLDRQTDQVALEALTHKQVQATLKKYMSPDRILFIRAGDQTKAKLNEQ